MSASTQDPLAAAAADSRAQRLIETLGDWLCAPAELCVLLMLIHMLLDIGARLVLGSGLEGMVESVTHLYMVGVAFLPVAALEARSQHLRVEALAERLPARGSHALALLAKAVTVVVGAVMCWLTAEQALDATMMSEHVELTRWSLPIWPARWVFPLAFGLMAIAALLHVVQLLRHPLTTRSDLS